MRFEGGCYCGQVRYVAEGEPVMKAQCHCRECQYISGGGPNFVMGLPAAGFAYVKGEPKGFARSDLERPVTREFCPNCGTHLATRSPRFDGLFLKVGTLDDPALYGLPAMAIHAADKQAFHCIPDDLPTFDRTPRR